MDKVKASRLALEFKDKDLNGFKIIKLINNGKSAAVFEAIAQEKNIYALKVFDKELVESYGHKIQEKRIELEVGLKEYSIPGLVQVINGGKFDLENEDYYYILMELVDGNNLKQFIETSEYNEDFIKSVLRSLVDTSEELLKIGIVHRDIKPENIMISDAGSIKLMDMSVLKHIGQPSFSDQDEKLKQFLGTLRYAPPEFLVREEKDTQDGWRAINLYQIGAVLHDLIMKKELFSDKSPFTVLSNAIQNEMPIISSSKYSLELIQLTRNLLIKSPEFRLKLGSLKLINSYLSMEEEVSDFEKEILKSKTLTNDYKNKLVEITKIVQSTQEIRKKRNQLLTDLSSMLESIMVEFKNDHNLILTYKLGNTFTYHSDRIMLDDFAIKNQPFVINKSIEHGFPENFYFSIGLKINEAALCTISAVAFYKDGFRKEDINDFQNMLVQVLNPHESIALGNVYQMPGTNRHQVINTKFSEIKMFEGVFSNDDVFRQQLKTQILKLLNKAISIGKPAVENELLQNKSIHKRESVDPSLIQRVVKKPYLFDSIE